MSKLQKKILLGVILTVLGILSFVYDIQPIFFTAFAALSSIVMFYNTKQITTGLVKLWCLSMLIVLFIIIGKDIFNSTKPITISFALYLVTNLFGLFLISKYNNDNNIKQKES